MSKVITLNRGSKRRLKQIRWKLVEIFSLALLAILFFAMSMFVMVWELRHHHPHSEPTKTHQIRGAEPTEVLQIVASCRGALNGLMAELIEGQLRYQVLVAGQKALPSQLGSCGRPNSVVKRYFK